MSADLIERLRACADYFEKFYGRTKTVETIREAADALAAAEAALSEMRAELALARKALERIGEFCSGDDTTLGAVRRIFEVRSIAARALASQDEGEER